ncbi:MAG: hypothetical protein A3K19_25535 [Lentisphaerae bacterium RIFOXYB12_FULL_65_16]|nr:MAG: hypothetical protein A3K18_32535 [Lentisphaerae bacterium RIFOXYA12_64_32]OGV84854.1 MAG: hypothetical protein A3K19_25535 [Lentisphaerae bacterium RIFOXYB12_FULL_65_16]
MKRQIAMALLGVGMTATLAVLAPRLGAEEKTNSTATAAPLDTYRTCEELKVRIAAQQKENVKLEQKLAAQEEALRNYRAVKARNTEIIAKLEKKP